ncbi:MAG: septal ring lytic transglycosylase RlpA family protein [Aquabacterium sp.]|nr:septal ring lytic transglycosylase RlpA family protein [Aquabacterium sp.]
MTLAAVLAGCASGPQPGGTRAQSPIGRVVEPGVRNPDKDGAPSDAPPNLASLPDPVPQVEPIKPGGPNKPYVVLGQSYEPVAADVSWKERGLASWYGTKFHGRRTASGEMFSMYGLTAAHRTLPIPSYARVRNLSNGKETIVRINDRGPFHSNRVMDLSYAAAVKLGVVSTGSAQVEIERLTFDEIRTGAWRRGTLMDPDAEQLAAAGASTGAPAPSTSTAKELGDDPIMSVVAKGVVQPVAPEVTRLPGVAVASDSASANTPIKDGQARAYTPDAKGFWVQLAALGKRDGVDRLQQKVASEMAALLPMLAVFHEAPYFKLQVGPYGTRSEALAAAQQAKTSLQLVPMVVERR